MTKIKAYELSKGFGIPSKEIVKVLHDYRVSDKNHMSALDENELDVIFEYYTQKNQVEDFSALFTKPAVKEDAKKEHKSEEKPAEDKAAERKPEEITYRLWHGGRKRAQNACCRYPCKRRRP